MAATLTDGSVKYWLNGLPIVILRKAAVISGAEAAWSNGLPWVAYDGVGGGGVIGPGAIKSIMWMGFTVGRGGMWID